MSSHIILPISGHVQAAAGNEPVVVTDLMSPETAVESYLKEYLVRTGFSSKYPNFKTVRVGTAHPLVILAFQMLSDQPASVELFPSVTVSYGQETEAAPLLGRGSSDVLLDYDAVHRIRMLRDAGRYFVSDANLDRLEAAVAANGQVMGFQVMTTWEGQLTLDIWSENRTVVVLLYDLIRGFLPAYKDRLGALGFSVATLQGTGALQVNIEFGKLLYGASVMSQMSVSGITQVLEIPLQTIESVTPSPDFEVTP